MSTRHRILITFGASLLGGGLGFGLSAALGGCTTCFTANNPVAIAAMLGVVSGWAALVGSGEG